MIPPMSIVTPEVFPIDSWTHCRQVSDKSYQRNSLDSFDMPLGDFDPLPLHPDHGANDQLDAEQPTPVLSFESKSVPPAMQGQCPYHIRKGCNDPQHCEHGRGPARERRGRRLVNGLAGSFRHRIVDQRQTLRARLATPGWCILGGVAEAARGRRAARPRR